ncbi:SPW repeat protein [Labrys portucalensis]|uniref:SPW repeat protein n=1 Tax=Labrys neptuniae TaxID=376174 RepID=A0ABV6ZJT0_9HYPH
MPTWHAWVMAFLLAYLALAALSEARQWEEWVTLGLGLWLIVAPWVLRFSSDTAAERAHWLVGGLVIVISLAAEWRFRHARTS